MGFHGIPSMCGCGVCEVHVGVIFVGGFLTHKKPVSICDSYTLRTWALQKPNKMNKYITCQNPFD